MSDAIPAPASPRLEASLGDIIGQTFRAYKKHFWVVFLISAIPLVPISILQSVSITSITESMARTTGAMTTPDEALRLLGEIFKAFALMMVLFAIYFVAYSLVQLSLIRALAQEVVGQTPDVLGSYSVASRRLWTCFLMWVFLGLVFSGGAGALLMVVLVPASIVMAVVAGASASPEAMVLSFLFLAFLVVAPIALYFGIRVAFATQAIAVEKAGVIKSIQRSFTLVKGKWWRTFGVMLAIGALAVAITLPVTLVARLIFRGPGLPFTVARYLVAAIIAALVAPISVLGATRYYFDLRARKEAYNLQALTDELART